MTQTAAHTDTTAPAPAPIGALARAVGFWGGGAALVAVAVAVSRGVADSAALGIVTVAASSMAGFGLLLSLPPRPRAEWAFPMMASQMMRTMLAPAIGLAVVLAGVVEPMAFWLTVLAVAGAMLVGETVAIAGLLGSRGRGGTVTMSGAVSGAEGADR